MNDSPQKLKLTLGIMLGLIAFGFSPILVRLVPGVSPVALAAYRTTFAALLLLPVWIVSRQKRKAIDERYTRKQKNLGRLAGICLGFHFTLWIASLSYTSVASASVLVSIHPIILIVVESFLMEVSFRKMTWTGVFIAFLGSGLLGFADEHAAGAFPHPLIGDALAVSAAIVFAIYFLIGRNLRQHSTWLDYVFLVYSYAAMCCLVLVLIFRIDMNVGLAAVLVALGLAIGPQIIGHGSMNYAVKYVSPTILATLILVEPSLAIVLAYLFFHEIPSLLSFVAIGVILIGVMFTWKAKTV